MYYYLIMWVNIMFTACLQQGTTSGYLGGGVQRVSIYIQVFQRILRFISVDMVRYKDISRNIVDALVLKWGQIKLVKLYLSFCHPFPPRMSKQYWSYVCFYLLNFSPNDSAKCACKLILVVDPLSDLCQRSTVLNFRRCRRKKFIEENRFIFLILKSNNWQVSEQSRPGKKVLSTLICWR